MKKTLIGTVVLAVMALFISSAQAITVKASIKKGVVAVTGSAAALNAAISWQGVNVATASAKGKFKFSGVVPADCVGELSDGVTTMDVALSGCTPKGAVLETGQTSCYDAHAIPTTVVNCAGTGQDGEFAKGSARSYTEDVNGLTITDNRTGLQWEKQPNCADNYSWYETFGKIAVLNTNNFAGHNDWRLPNVNELQTLVDRERGGAA